MIPSREVTYWQGCLERVKPDDVFGRFLITGKIKELKRMEQEQREESVSHWGMPKVSEAVYGDATLMMVDEFHKAFNHPRPTSPGEMLPGFPDEGVVNALLFYAGELKRMARRIHEDAAQYGGNLPLLRMQLMVEELSEVCEAIVRRDTAHLLHEMADMRYVCDGTAIAFGIGDVLEPAVGEIHRANMSKLDEHGLPILNEAGRVVKSTGFRPADVSKLVKKGY